MRRRVRIGLAVAAVAAVTLACPVHAQNRASDVTLQTPTGVLHGTRLVPERAATQPVLILAGSGPTDRDGNSAPLVRAGYLRQLAEGLAAQGTPTLRVDKRGIAASAAAGGAEEALRVQTFADDARVWAAKLKADLDAPCVWLLGHSEGGLHAMLAARDNPDVCGLVLVSAPGRSLGDILREQLRANPANAPILDNALGVLAELEAGRPVAEGAMHPALLPLFRPSVQPFVMSMLALDPADLLRRTRGPVLVVQGTTDIQTGAADAQALSTARAGVTLRMLEGVNHVLKEAPADRAENFASYSDPGRPLAPSVLPAISDFLRVNASEASRAGRHVGERG